MSTSSNKSFLPDTTKKILQSQFRGEKTKISDDVVQLVIEIINAGVAESVLRAGKQAKKEGSDTIHLEHVEKVLPQLELGKKCETKVATTGKRRDYGPVNKISGERILK